MEWRGPGPSSSRPRITVNVSPRPVLTEISGDPVPKDSELQQKIAHKRTGRAGLAYRGTSSHAVEFF